MPNFPVHEELDVKDGYTIFKSDDWWKAVVLYEGFNGSEVAVYLWKKQDGEWKRQQKYKADQQEWEETKEAIEQFLNEIEGE